MCCKDWKFGWDTKLLFIILILNSTQHSTTDFTPFKLVFITFEDPFLLHDLVYRIPQVDAPSCELATCNSWLPKKLVNGYISFPNEIQCHNVLISPVEDLRSVIIGGEIGSGGCGLLKLLIYWIKHLLWGLTRSSGMMHVTKMCCSRCYNDAAVSEKKWIHVSNVKPDNFTKEQQ